MCLRFSKGKAAASTMQKPEITDGCALSLPGLPTCERCGDPLCTPTGLAETQWRVLVNREGWIHVGNANNNLPRHSQESTPEPGRCWASQAGP